MKSNGIKKIGISDIPSPILCIVLPVNIAVEIPEIINAYLIFSILIQYIGVGVYMRDGLIIESTKSAQKYPIGINNA